MNKLSKIGIGTALWIFYTYVFACWAHIAPEGAYDGVGSSLEFASVGLMIACFIGMPILIALWCKDGEK